MSASGRGGQPGTCTSTGVVVEDACGRAAGAHRDGVLRVEHLVVDAADDRRHLDRDASRQDEQVRLARRGAERLEAEPGDVQTRADHRHHLDGAARQAERRREQRVAAGPVGGLVERRRDDALLDVLLEVAAVEVAAKHVARLQLPDPEVALRAGLLPLDDLHDSLLF
jgi:hypothetical protein